MSRSQTSIVEAPPVPLTELPSFHQLAKGDDVETAPVEEIPAGHDVVDREPETPFFKLIVVGYSFFCAGAGMSSLVYQN